MILRPTRRAGLAAAAAAVFLPRTAWPQEPGRPYRIGVLSNFTREALRWAAFFDELAKSGFAEGKNLIVDPRGFQFPVDQAAGLVEQLVQSGVDAILCAGKPMSALVQTATRTIPILSVTDDMLVEGLIHSLAHPGGNLTGISIFSSELNGKRQEILLDLLPEAHHIAALLDPGTAGKTHIMRIQPQLGQAIVDHSPHDTSTASGGRSRDRFGDCGRSAGRRAL